MTYSLPASPVAPDLRDLQLRAAALALALAVAPALELAVDRGADALAVGVDVAGDLRARVVELVLREPARRELVVASVVADHRGEVGGGAGGGAGRQHGGHEQRGECELERKFHGREYDERGAATTPATAAPRTSSDPRLLLFVVEVQPVGTPDRLTSRRLNMAEGRHRLPQRRRTHKQVRAGRAQERRTQHLSRRRRIAEQRHHCGGQHPACAAAADVAAVRGGGRAEQRRAAHDRERARTPRADRRAPCADRRRPRGSEGAEASARSPWAGSTQARERATPP